MQRLLCNVCWSLPCAVQKRINQSKCRLRANSYVPKEPRIRRGTGSRSPTGRGTFGEACRPIAGYKVQLLKRRRKTSFGCLSPAARRATVSHNKDRRQTTTKLEWNTARQPVRGMARKVFKNIKSWTHKHALRSIPGLLGWECHFVWQVTLCDPIWHVSSRSGEASCQLLYSVYLYLFTFTPNEIVSTAVFYSAVIIFVAFLHFVRLPSSFVEFRVIEQTGVQRTELNWVRCYIPLDTKRSFWRYSSQATSWLGTGKK